MEGLQLSPNEDVLGKIPLHVPVPGRVESRWAEWFSRRLLKEKSALSETLRQLRSKQIGDGEFW